MATVKTTGTGATLRILTKTADGVQRVSCSCCEEVFCCPYPADQLGVGYTQEDLPDTIDLDITFDSAAGNRVVLSRNGQEYGPYVQTIGATTTSHYVIIETSFGQLEWCDLKVFSTGGESLTFYGSCLYQPSGSRVEDTFADAYQVSGPVSGTVTRESLCVWSGTGLTLSNYGYQWKVNGRNKSGNQNTPVGSYADGYSVAL
jgi:hypothetical protein